MPDLVKTSSIDGYYFHQRVSPDLRQIEAGSAASLKALVASSLIHNLNFFGAKKPNLAKEEVKA
jgi:hypothetical protein